MSGEQEQSYFVRHRGKVVGPFPVARLKQLLARGQFSRFHEISTDRQIWQSATVLQEVFGRQSLHSESRSESAAAPLFQDTVPEFPGSQSVPGGPPENASRKSQWYYNAGGEENGPIPFMELRGLIANGQLLPNDQVWRDGMPDWEFIQNVAELKSLVRFGNQSAPSHNPQNVYGGQEPYGITRTSALAVAGMTFGILGLLIALFMSSISWIGAAIIGPRMLIGLYFALGLFALIAVIFGSIALFSIGGSRGTMSGKGMAITGLVTGVISLAIWLFGLLVSLEIINL